VGAFGRKVRSELPANAAYVTLWRNRLDRAKTSPIELMKFYKVPTKRPKRDAGLIVRGEEGMTLFDPWPSQIETYETIMRQWARGEGGKTLDCKPRQDGKTTFFILFDWTIFLQDGVGTGNYFSYDDPHSMEAFALYKKLRDQTPSFVFEHLMHERFDPKTGEYVSGGGNWTKKSNRQLELTFPGGISHLIQCATAGGEYSGSGSSPRRIYLDEITKYPEKVKKDHTGMSEGWADHSGNVCAYWGTGQGPETYAEIFLKHVGVQAEDGYVAHFTKWLGHPDRRKPFASDFDKEKFRATVGMVKEFGQIEERVLVDEGATMEELNWRRAKLATPAFNFNLRLFAREYPLTVREAFMSDAGTIFPTEILQTHLAAARHRLSAAVRGDFEESGKKVVFVESYAGAWTLYEHPREDLFACWGADSASGHSNSDGADWSDAVILDVYTGRVLARYRGRLEGREFGKLILDAARHYEAKSPETGAVFARGYPEINGESGAAMLTAMIHYCETRDFALEEFVMNQEHPLDGMGERPAPTPGWRTERSAKGSASATWGSRGTLIDNAKAFIRETGEWKKIKCPCCRGAEFCRAATPYDPVFLEEAMRFAKDDKGRIEAKTGHDDAVFSTMLALTARDVLVRGGDVPVQSRVPKKNSDDWYVRQLKREWKANRPSADPVLGSRF